MHFFVCCVSYLFNIRKDRRSDLGSDGCVHFRVEIYISNCTNSGLSIISNRVLAKFDSKAYDKKFIALSKG